MSERAIDDKIKWHKEQIELSKARIQYHSDRILLLESSLKPHVLPLLEDDCEQNMIKEAKLVV